MADAFAGDEQRRVAVPALLVGRVGVADPRLVEAEHLVVIGMHQFMQHAPRLDVDLARLQQLGRHRDVDAIDQVGVVAVFLQPIDLGVILHGHQLAVRHVEHDREALQLGQDVRAHHRL